MTNRICDLYDVNRSNNNKLFKIKNSSDAKDLQTSIQNKQSSYLVFRESVRVVAGGIDAIEPVLQKQTTPVP